MSDETARQLITALNAEIVQLKTRIVALENDASWKDQDHALARRQLAAVVKENMQQRDLIREMEREIAGLNQCLDECDKAFEVAGDLLRSSTQLQIRSN